MTKTPYKKCNKCNELKPATLEYFHKHSSGPNALQSHCKDCVRANGQKTRPITRKKQKLWQKANPKKAYRFTHPEEAKQSSQNWKDANRDKVRQVNRQWRRNNLKKSVEITQRRRARKIGNGGDYTTEEWEALCAFYGNRCLCCKEQKSLTVDHVIPISKGGRSSIDNLQPLCQECNSRKWNKTIDYRFDNGAFAQSLMIIC